MENEVELKKQIGKRIELTRKEMKLTKEKLARKIGITPQYLGIIEKGDSALSYAKLQMLCNVSGYSADYFLFGKDIQIEEKTKLLLTEFSYSEIQKACETIKQIAFFIKDSKK